jgi:hypothetical protein
VPVANANLLTASDGVQQILGIGSEVASGRGDPFCKVLVGQAACIALARAVRHEGQSAEDTFAGVSRDPARAIAIAAHLPPPGATRHLGKGLPAPPQNTMGTASGTSADRRD